MVDQYMRLALDLAAEWRGSTTPNPMVGAVVVKDGQIVGKGAHQRAGEPHAEVYALNDAGEAAKGSTLYVTLEPCSHYGKTPPCTEKIIACGVAKVIAAMEDPNPLVKGRGLAQLRDAGIEVEVGMGEAEAKKLNEVFLKYIVEKKPFVILKTAVTLDGKIAAKTGESKWITNELARERVHHLRNHVDAILVGKGTLLSDNPRLNVRLENKFGDPQKIILTSRLDVDPSELKEMAAYQLSQENKSPLILVGAKELVDQARVDAFKKMGVDVILVDLITPMRQVDYTNSHNSQSNQAPNQILNPQQILDLDQLLTKLSERGIVSLLLEGGSGVYTSFLQAGLVDKVYLFQAPVILGDDGIGWVQAMGAETIQQGWRLHDVEYEQFGDNILTIGYL